MITLNRILTTCLTLLAVGTSARLASADDWPQWMGPQRDNIWRETGLLEKFPDGGPKVLWRTPLAGGYAGPAVSNGRLFITDYVTGENVKVDNFDRATNQGTERVLCLDEKTGKVLWKHESPVTYGISYPSGPRCTPTVDGERVYTLGAEGSLICFNVADGKVIWSKELKEEYKTKSALWGYASHPLIDGDKLICVVGTDLGHAAAFDKMTGKELWRTGPAPEQGYTPPSIQQVAGERQLIFMKPDALYAVDPESGKLLWETPYSADNGSIIMTPVRVDDHLYVGGFQEKNLLVKLAKVQPGVEVIWKDKPKHGISPVNVQPFVADGLIYGFHEKGELRAVQIPSGEILWKSNGPFKGRAQGSATAFLVRQGDRFWMFTETGDLVIAKLTPEGYEELDRTHLIKPTNFAFGREVVWCPPAFANRCIYVRNDEEIIAVSLAGDQGD
ncbi:PQQ-binding-like beta-propeller repeat protein [Planctomicrobium sp. SH661]|uniref:PQQ-binding-like beta-propeller repeat protein n=1 Tax=Planctomicrobium sp. SH661 TaxID=3448124 RepID=UPI003F5B3CFF